MHPSADPRAFILANTRLKPVPHVPEIVLHVADESVPLWHKTEEELGEAGLPPPYWAFAWAGGQALARYVLDHRDLVRGRRVLDLAAGSGLVAIAAARAGAAPVIAADIDPFAEAAIALNAQANGVYIDILLRDLLDEAAHVPAKHAPGTHRGWTPVRRQEHAPPGRVAEPRYDVILCGDLFYEQDTAARALRFLDRHAALGATVLIGDPGRTYLPKERLVKQCEYAVPVTRDLEDLEIKRTAVWSLG
jgi:predicted nicotinamide N-methyase